jgi:hypothetical protein
MEIPDLLDIGLFLSFALIIGLCLILVVRAVVLPDPSAPTVAPAVAIKTEEKKEI